MFTVAFDARATEPGFKAHFGRGTGRYASELLSELLRLAADGLPVRVTPMYREDLRGSAWEQRLIRSMPLGRLTAETQLFLPRRLKNFPADMLHFVSHGDATARCTKPYIVTVLDLIPMRFPELYKADKPDWRWRLARSLEHQAIANACGVVAISEATKRDVVELLGVLPERVRVTPLGVNRSFKPRPSSFVDWLALAANVKARLDLPRDRPVLLYIGGIDQRKNIPFLLEVFAELLRECNLRRYPVSAHPLLVMAGNYEQDDQFPALKQMISRLGLEEHLRLFGFVSEDRMKELLHAAHLKIFPSLYEGFGLPVLEAMASGLPVAAGNNSSIPEVAGNSALLLPDGKKSVWVEGILTLFQQTSELERLSSLGLRQASLFTWERTARETLAAYQYFAADTALIGPYFSDSPAAATNLAKRSE